MNSISVRSETKKNTVLVDRRKKKSLISFSTELRKTLLNNEPVGEVINEVGMRVLSRLASAQYLFFMLFIYPFPSRFFDFLL